MSVYISRIIVYLTFISLLIITQSGCFKIYKQDLRQGNYVTQEKIDKLTVGLSKEKVQKIMGTPALVPVMDVNQWDYYYSFTAGNEKTVERKTLSLYFVNDRLKNFDGDWVPAHLPCKLKQ